jgi:transcriptional antiterminator NusG
MRNKQWYLIKIQSGFEKQVKNTLLQKINMSYIKQDFGTLLIPTESVLRVYLNQKITKKSYPGYLLAEIYLSMEAWYLVSKTFRVQGFLGKNKENPEPLRNNEVMKLLGKMLDIDKNLTPNILYDIGEIVRIKNGPFSDFTGSIENINYVKNKLRVAVIIFGRPTPIELNFTQIEKE